MIDVSSSTGHDAFGIGCIVKAGVFVGARQFAGNWVADARPTGWNV